MPMLYGTIVPNKRLRSQKKIQNEAARIVTGAAKPASIQSLLSDTGYESLTSRREKYKLVLFYKKINSSTPEDLSSLVPPALVI